MTEKLLLKALKKKLLSNEASPTLNFAKTLLGKLNIKKGKKLPTGTVRQWGGVKYKKVSDGKWAPVKKESKKESTKDSDKNSSNQDLNHEAKKLLDFAQMSDRNIKFEDLSVEASDKGNWIIYNKGEKLSVVRGDLLGEKTIQKYGLEHHKEDKNGVREIKEIKHKFNYNYRKDGKELNGQIELPIEVTVRNDEIVSAKHSDSYVKDIAEKTGLEVTGVEVPELKDLKNDNTSETKGTKENPYSSIEEAAEQDFAPSKNKDDKKPVEKQMDVR